jgi:4-amino-4-deoxy-L-arabinose transferase-like glycosyltransferase
MKNVRGAAWAALLCCAAIQGWVYRHDISPDGVAYLDLSDGVVNGRLGELVNGYWSPVYPIIVGLLRLSLAWTPLSAPYWEFTLLHLASFLGFVLSLRAFEWFLDALTLAGASWAQQPFATPRGRVFAYAFFGVASLSMISVRGTLPDFFLAAATFAAFACLLRLRERPTDRMAAVQLGAALALGALTKSFFFPFGAIVLATLLLALRGGHRFRVAEAAGVFAVLTIPWIVALSLALGKPTTGETGALNYAWYVNEIQAHNSGVMPALAQPAGAIPLDGLAVFPDARGTNPLWYDPARWHRDVRPRFSARQQLPRVWWSIRYYVYVTAPILLVLAGIAAAARWADSRTALHRSWIVLAPSLVAYAAYAMVYATSRYVAPFLVASCLALVAAFPWSARLRPYRFGIAAGIVVLVLLLIAPLRGMQTITTASALALAAWLATSSRTLVVRLLISLVAAAIGISLVAYAEQLHVVIAGAVGLALWIGLAEAQRARDVVTGGASELRLLVIGAVAAWSVPAVLFTGGAIARGDAGNAGAHPEWGFATQMQREGVVPGSKIALIGNPEQAGWARLLRVQIVAVIPQHRVAAFTKLSATERDRVLQAFAAAGATRMVVQPSRAALRDQ